MGQDNLPGAFEELVLLAVARDPDGAYGMIVRREIEERSGRSVAIGAVYATLERLLQKGMLASFTRPGGPERKGRGRKYYRLRPEGARALERAREVHQSMWEGLDLTAAVEAGGGEG